MTDFERGVEAMRAATIEIYQRTFYQRTDVASDFLVNIKNAKVTDNSKLDDDYENKLKNRIYILKFELQDAINKANADQAYIKGQIEGIEFVIDKIKAK